MMFHFLCNQCNATHPTPCLTKVDEDERLCDCVSVAFFGVPPAQRKNAASYSLVRKAVLKRNLGR